MGDIRGFKKYDRTLPTNEPVKKRVEHFNEFVPTGSAKLLNEQSARCMDCGIPFCHSACPLGNLIPEFNNAVHEKDFKTAYELLIETNNFPEFTGRICPAPCEGSCVLGINKPPVAIEYIEKSIIERAFEKGWVDVKKRRKRTGKTIAIIGSGPAGLACADQLNKAGHTVVVYEKNDKPGGLLRYGIPDFKLDKSVVERRIRLMKKQGVKFVCKTNVGQDVKIKDLKSSYDAVVLCGGCEKPRDLDIKGRSLSGIYPAMEFLSQCNKFVQDGKKMDISVAGKKVLVIGGGDTGSDCVGNANRFKAKSVMQIELFPTPPKERADDNMWPLMPKVLKTTSSHEEGCEREWAINTKAFVGDSEKNITGIEIVDLEWAKDKHGKYKMQELKATKRILEADVVFLAMGFTAPIVKDLISKTKIKQTETGTIKANNYQTTDKQIFTAGDMRRGQSLVVWAIAEGRECAEAVEAYLG